MFLFQVKGLSRRISPRLPRARQPGTWGLQYLKLCLQKQAPSHHEMITSELRGYRWYIYAIGVKENSERHGVETEPALGGPGWKDNPAASTSATSTLVSRQLFIHISASITSTTRQKLRVPGRQRHQTNQDLSPDSSSHPKARGLLSWIWYTGTLMEIGRGPSWEVAQQADLNSLNKTRTTIRLVIKKDQS